MWYHVAVPVKGYENYLVDAKDAEKAMDLCLQGIAKPQSTTVEYTQGERVNITPYTQSQFS